MNQTQTSTRIDSGESSKQFWDRADVERRHLESYVVDCKSRGEVPVLTFRLRGGKVVQGFFVELGQFVYIVEVQVEGVRQKTMIPKHAIDTIFFGKVGKNGEA